MDSWGRVGTSPIIEMSFVPDRAGIKKLSFFFHFVSFWFPLYINTVGALEKILKITWDFFVQSSAPLLLPFMNSSYFSDFTCNCISGFSFNPTPPRTVLLDDIDFVAPSEHKEGFAFPLLGWFAALSLVPPGLGGPGHCCCSCLEQALPPPRVLGSCCQCAAKCCP